MDEQTRNERILNPPTVFAECPTCDHLHPTDHSGDCRDDEYRFTEQQLNERYGGSWVMQWLEMQYECICGNTWTDQWSCAVDDTCSDCGCSVEPSTWEQIL